MKLTYQYLKEINKALNQYNNVVAGANINVMGNKNLIVGSYVTVRGNNNWIFVNYFKGQVNEALVI